MVKKRKRDDKEKKQRQKLRRKEREKAEKNDDALIQAAIDESAYLCRLGVVGQATTEAAAALEA